MVTVAFSVKVNEESPVKISPLLLTPFETSRSILVLFCHEMVRHRSLIEMYSLVLDRLSDRGAGHMRV